MAAVAEQSLRLDAVLEAVLQLRESLVTLDALELSDAAAHVDQALALIEPLHPDVVAGLHGSRPFPARLQAWLEGCELG